MCFGHTTTSLTGLLLQLQDLEPCSAGKQTIYACVMKRRKALRQPRYEKVRLIYLLLERLIPRNPQTTPHLSSVSQQHVGRVAPVRITHQSAYSPHSSTAPSPPHH